MLSVKECERVMNVYERTCGFTNMYSRFLQANRVITLRNGSTRIYSKKFYDAQDCFEYVSGFDDIAVFNEKEEVFFYKNGGRVFYNGFTQCVNKDKVIRVDFVKNIFQG